MRRRLVAGDKADRAKHGLVDLGRGRAEPAPEQHAQLIDDRLVPARREHVDQGLGGEDLPDRRGERGPAGLGPDPHELVEHLVDPVPGRVRPQMQVERGDETRGKAVLGGASRDPRRDRRDGLVTDALIDELGGPP